MNCTHPKCCSTEEREQESQGLKQPAKVPWRAADPELNPEGWVQCGWRYSLGEPQKIVWANTPFWKLFWKKYEFRVINEVLSWSPDFSPPLRRMWDLGWHQWWCFSPHLFYPAIKLKCYLPCSYPVEMLKGLKDSIKLCGPLESSYEKNKF